MKLFSKEDQLIKNCLILLTSIIFILLTTLLPIVTKVPDILFVNKIGFFIFTLYFGFIPSTLFILIVQGFFLKFGLVDSLLSYALVINIVNVFLISIFLGKKEPSIKPLIASLIMMSIFSKPITLAILSLTSDTSLNIGSMFTVESIVAQGKSYGLSLIVSLIIYYLYESVSKVKRRNQ